MASSSSSAAAPRFSRPVSRRTTCAAEGTAVLEAVATGRPPPAVTWLRNGAPVDLDRRGKRRAQHEADTGKCRLVISDLGEDDEGEYECRAKNRLGQVSCFGELYVDNEVLESKSGLFILIDEGSQDDDTSADEMGCKESISASEQIESIIEDLTMGDGSLSLSMSGPKEGGEQQHFASDADDHEDLPLDDPYRHFKPKPLRSIDEDLRAEEIFEDAEEEEGTRHGKPGHRKLALQLHKASGVEENLHRAFEEDSPPSPRNQEFEHVRTAEVGGKWGFHQYSKPHSARGVAKISAGVVSGPSCQSAPVCGPRAFDGTTAEAEQFDSAAVIDEPRRSPAGKGHAASSGKTGKDHADVPKPSRSKAGKHADVPEVPRGKNHADVPEVPRGKNHADVPEVPHGKNHADVPEVPHGKNHADVPEVPRGKNRTDVPEVPRGKNHADSGVAKSAALEPEVCIPSENRPKTYRATAAADHDGWTACSRRNTTDGVEPREREATKMVRQRSHSDGRAVPTEPEFGGEDREQGSPHLCPWESLEKIWRDSLPTESGDEPAPSDAETGCDEVFLDVSREEPDGGAFEDAEEPAEVTELG